MFKKHFLLSCICATLFTSTSAYTADSQNKASNASISDKDIQLIEDKKSALIYMLMERGELEPLLKELRKQKSDQIIETEIAQSFPYTKEQIQQRRALTLEEQKAKNEPLHMKMMEITEEDYDPNSNTPIRLRVASNNPTSIAFFDYQGNPWPIVGDVIGDPSSFVSFPFAETKNTAVFQVDSEKRFSESTALINLQGVNQLIVVKLIGDESVFDARKSIRIPLKGPLSDDKVMDTNKSIDSSDPILVKLLNGEKIIDGIEYESDWDTDTKFIRLGNYLYVRTKDQVTFPPNIENQVSASGYKLYKLYFSNTATMLKDGRYKVVSIRKKSKVSSL